ncbi:MAG: vWA domain-containing protein [Phycisphaeraceae bacterium]
MNKTILQLLGFNADNIPDGATTEFVWTASDYLGGLGVFAFVGAVLLLAYLVFWVYRREMAVCPPKVRYFLATVRILVIVVLAIVLLGPAIKVSENKTRQATILVLVDESLSMLSQDRYLDDEAAQRVATFLGTSIDSVRADPPNRAVLINEILRREQYAFLTKLREKGDVKFITFSSKLGTTQVLSYSPSDPQKRAALYGGGTITGPIEQPSFFQYLFLENWAPMVIAFIAIGAMLVLLSAVLKNKKLQPLIGGIVLIALAGIVYWVAESVETDRERRERLAESGESEKEKLSDEEIKRHEEDARILAGIGVEPTGQRTDIARAIREAINSAAGKQIGAVIVITDGQNNVRDSDPLIAADYAFEQGVPVLTLGVGDPSKKRNLRVNSVKANETVRRNNPFQIEAEIEAEGLDATSAMVELVIRSETGEQVVQQKQVNLPSSVGSDDGQSGSAVQNLSFEYTPKTAGVIEFAIRVPKVGRETDEEDNLSKPVRVMVRSDKARVLLISGGPTWEYRPLLALLTRDSDVNLSVWLQTMDLDMKQEGNTPINHLPATPKEMYDYDAVIMLDPDPREFNEQWIENLRVFLAEHGGGLLFMPGPKYSTAFLGGIRTQEFRDLLPVRFGDMGALDVKALISSHTKEWPLAIRKAEMDHPIMRFDTTNPSFNEAVWAAMPGIYWTFPALNPKPATRVLIEHSDPAMRAGRDPRPLVVSGFYGPGRVVYLGLNGTWRWRRLGVDAEYYEKFWLQSVNYIIAGRDQRGNKRGYIDLAKDSFSQGDQIKIQAKLYDPQFGALDLNSVDALVKVGRTVIPLRLERLNAEDVGHFTGSFTAGELGPHEITIQLESAEGGSPVLITKAFDVTRPAAEMNVTQLNKGVLREIAERTKGEYFEVDQWQEIAAQVADRTQTIIVPRKPYELWSTDRLLMLLVILLTIEWAVRKRFKLL